MADAIPAGWYPNPWNDAEELYWSGTDWTGISRTAHRQRVPDAVAASAPSEVEDSTVMRPVGAPAFEAPVLEAPVLDVPTVATPIVDAPTVATPIVDAPTVATPIVDAPTYAAPGPGAAPGAAVYDAPAFDAQGRGEPPVTAQYPAQPYQGRSYPAQSYPAEPYPAQSYPAESYPAQPYQAEPYPGPAAPVQPSTGQQNAPDAASIRWALGSERPAPPANRRARFGLISMIVGIAAVVFAIIPGLSFAAWVPAFVAIAFGIIAFVGARPRTYALVGIITGGAALAIGTAVSIWFLVQLGALAH